MKLESEGVLISLRPFGERDLIAHVFTSEYGVICGMMRGAASVRVKNRPLVGQVGTVTWGARLDSQLGVIHWDASKNLSAPLMADSQKLNFMNSAFCLIDALLPERECYANLYVETLDMLNALGQGGASTDVYLIWEVNLLRELGYALDLTRCSGCGAVQNLHYLSPRTGRAVCDTCAAPYIGRLYRLPLDLYVTGRFVDLVCNQQGTNMPLARKMLKI